MKASAIKLGEWICKGCSATYSVEQAYCSLCGEPKTIEIDVELYKYLTGHYAEEIS